MKTVNLYRAFITCDMQCEGAYEPDLTGFWPRPRGDLLFSCPCLQKRTLRLREVTSPAQVTQWMPRKQQSRF